MFNLFKSKEEKRQEQIAAYIDQEMEQTERSRFEALLRQDAELQAGLESQQTVKSLLSQIPRLKAPRNFVLNPAVYGGKAPAPSLIELLYPKMKVATAAVSFMFVILLGVGFLQSGLPASAPSQPENIALDSADVEADTDAAGEAAMESEAIIQATAPALSANSSEEKAIVVAEAEVVEAEVVEAEIVEEAMFDSAESEAPISPRQAEPADLSGERVGMADSEIAPEPAEAPAAKSIEATPAAEVAKEAVEVSTNSELVDDTTDEALDEALEEALEEAPNEAGPLRTQLPPTVIAIWFLGLLLLMFASATLIIRRKLD
ncbi:MAG: hypothetical protein ACI9EW_000416 [Cellvibrionaceae bacterium]